MRGFQKWMLFPLILGLIGLFGYMLIASMSQQKAMGVADQYTIATFIINEESLRSSADSGSSIDLSFGVLYYPGEIVEGTKIMDGCAIAVYNPGPGTAELTNIYFTWNLGEYASGSGYYDVGTLSAEDVEMISCTDIFGSEGTMIIIPLPRNKFILNNIPLVVEMHTSYGKYMWEGSTNYIPQKALI